MKLRSLLIALLFLLTASGAAYANLTPTPEPTAVRGGTTPPDPVGYTYYLPLISR